VTISGFSDKISVLLEVVINKIVNFVVSPDSLELAQDYVGSWHAILRFHLLTICRSVANYRTRSLVLL
jgi:hypothetical protein